MGKWFPDAICKVLVQTMGRARAKWKSGAGQGRILGWSQKAQGSGSISFLLLGREEFPLIKYFTGWPVKQMKCLHVRQIGRGNNSILQDQSVLKVMGACLSVSLGPCGVRANALCAES